jgi:hypothetical protein
MKPEQLLQEALPKVVEQINNDLNIETGIHLAKGTKIFAFGAYMRDQEFGIYDDEMNAVEIYEGKLEDVTVDDLNNYFFPMHKIDEEVVMLNPHTLDKYKELKKGEAKLEGAFFAFGKTQFEEGYSKLVNEGYITEGEKIYQAGAGLYGTKEGLDKVFDYYKNKEKRIKEECDPQEVYFYEYNNHECMFTSDEDAIKEV